MSKPRSDAQSSLSGAAVQRQGRQKQALGAGYLLVAAGGLTFLFKTESLPPLSQLLWFVALAGLVDWRSVEISPKLRASSTVMVILAAGVAFRDYGSGLAMALVAAGGAVGPVDIRERRVFFPAVNLGQLIVSAVAGGVTLHWLFDAMAESGGLSAVAVAAGLAGVVQATVNFAQVSIIRRLVIGTGEQRPWSGMNQVLAAYALLSAVGGLFGATYTLVGSEVTPFIVIMVLMAHFAATSYAAEREARESTMRGFIKALEARDLYAKGHTERVAHFATLIAEELGLRAARIERLRWAALLSDVSSLAVPRDLLEHQDHLTAEEQLQIDTYTGTVDDMLARVAFLESAMEIVRRRDFSRIPEVVDHDATDAHVLGVAKRFDQLTFAGRHEARTQQQAFAALRDDRDRRFLPHVVEALERSVENSGMTYGAIELSNPVTLDDLAKRRIYERR